METVNRVYNCLLLVDFSTSLLSPYMPPHTTNEGQKTLKISPELHRKLKSAAAEFGMTLQNYLEFILNMHFSEDMQVQSHLQAAIKSFADTRSEPKDELKREAQELEEATLQFSRSSLAHSTDPKELEKLFRELVDAIVRERVRTKPKKEPKE